MSSAIPGRRGRSRLSRAEGEPMSALDPRPFAPESIDPETAEFNRKLEAAIAAAPDLTAFPPAAIRKAREEGRSIWGPVQTVAEARERRIPGPAGELRLRVLAPDEVRGVYLHMHGGGWTLGAANQSDLRNQAIARRCGLATVSVEYRLAPEHPYPAGPDDCEAAALWLVENAPAEFGTTRLWIGGESAGAHLAAVTLLRLRDRHGLAPFAGANLVYGCYDLSMTPSQRRWGDRNLILSTPIIQWFAGFFVPDPARRRDPDVSPLYADLAGMPPALFTVGTLDPLLDDSLFLHARWIAAGGRAELALWPGAIHGFDAFPTQLSREARARMDAFLGA
jgi:acetyl esterase/lipase